MDQALEVLNAVENVSAMEASNIHPFISMFLNKWYKQPASWSIQKNHIFSFSSKIKNVIMTTKISDIVAVTSTQSIKKMTRMYRTVSESWMYCGLSLLSSQN